MTPEIEKRIKAVQAGRQLNVRQEMKKIEDIFEETCEKNHPDAEVLTIIQGVGTVPREQSGREIIYDKSSLASYKFVKKGDFIIHLRSFEGGLEVANSDGIVSPAYVILHPKIEVSTIYLYALFHTNRFINQTMAPAVEGARDGRSVKYDVLKKQKILFPPLSEQKKIAEILATQDRVIELKEKLIAEKQSQKKYMINKLFFQETTRGSKKWETKRLIEVASSISDGDWIESDDQSAEGIRLIQTGNIGNGFFIDKESRARFISEDTFSKLNCTEIFCGDLLLSRLPDPIGRVCIVPQFKGRMITAVDCTIIRFDREDLKKFFLYFAQTEQYFNLVQKLAGGSTRKRISRREVENIAFSFPIDSQDISFILEVLSAADEEISLLQKDLEQEKLKKKSLMQLLLTGLVRVQ